MAEIRVVQAGPPKLHGVAVFQNWKQVAKACMESEDFELLRLTEIPVEGTDFSS